MADKFFAVLGCGGSGWKEAMKIIKKTAVLLVIAGVMSGCVARQETWLNHGHGTVKVEKSMIHCYTDASLIDGERLEGTLCVTNSSGFIGDGEPEIKFGPWGRKLIFASATKSLSGVQREWQGKNFNLQCKKILSNAGEDIGRDCNVKANDQHLMSANRKRGQIYFSPSLLG